ncbi:DUF4296 domain-containing protein [Spirosoma sp. KCTC 42546]|uniref:DUF4296 domain-containing protein n=1 Tax=Spirosoma sp. KCTC 42546 TaxID=2520506 RepID=UPI001157C1EB|nr:DUF4296 domain-containing protein [Spirosoma sp. KCTC 42546]QDK83037.1 DUF4296 domain-containing protein [Spirosoma sp. KCTC 42546]
MHRNRFCAYLWSVLLGGWLVVACTAPEDEKPDGLIATDKMADILTEVHMTEARISRLGLASIDSSNIAYKHLEANIFKKFGVDTATYRTSYIFYSSHPQDMELIYKRVTDNLQKKISAKNAKQPKG